MTKFFTFLFLQVLVYFYFSLQVCSFHKMFFSQWGKPVLYKGKTGAHAQTYMYTPWSVSVCPLHWCSLKCPGLSPLHRGVHWYISPWTFMYWNSFLKKRKSLFLIEKTESQTHSSWLVVHSRNIWMGLNVVIATIIITIIIPLLLSLYHHYHHYHYYHSYQHHHCYQHHRCYHH